jgi:hypothetical protein
MTLPVDRRINSPKSKSEADKTVLMGKLSKGIGLPPSALEPNAKLETALDNLRRAIGIAGRGGQNG